MGKCGVWLLLIANISAASVEPEERALFFLTRTTNRNLLVYTAKMRNGAFVTKDPIDAYWNMIEKDGKREPLTSLEKKKLYGVELLSTQLQEVEFHLKAQPTHLLTARLRAKVPYVVVRINGKEIELERVHLILGSSGLLPSVKAIEYYGHSVEGGTALVEVEQVTQ